MVFTFVSSPDSVASALADKIRSHLKQEQRVLWLLPGGSNITVAVAAAKLLEGTELELLSVTLTDERHGDIGHPDSNWQQLLDAGFDLPGADLYPVLAGKDMSSTTEQYDSTLRNLLETTEYSLGFFGIGPDGHTAGILPGSPAVTAAGFAAGYSANFERITMTAHAIAKLSEAVVYASGETKWPVIDQLEQTIDPSIQPAQFLKQVPELIIFNDHKGEEL